MTSCDKVCRLIDLFPSPVLTRVARVRITNGPLSDRRRAPTRGVLLFGVTGALADQPCPRCARQDRNVLEVSPDQTVLKVAMTKSCQASHSLGSGESYFAVV